MHFLWKAFQYQLPVPSKYLSALSTLHLSNPCAYSDAVWTTLAETVSNSYFGALFGLTHSRIVVDLYTASLFISWFRNEITLTWLAKYSQYVWIQAKSLIFEWSTAKERHLAHRQNYSQEMRMIFPTVPRAIQQQNCLLETVLRKRESIHSLAERRQYTLTKETFEIQMQKTDIYILDSHHI